MARTRPRRDADPQSLVRPRIPRALDAPRWPRV